MLTAPCPLRIAITADPYIPVPPRLYGGIERVIDLLIRTLTAHGHEVTLFAHPQSNSAATLVPYGSPPHLGIQRRAAELAQLGGALWRRRGSFDLVHSFGRLAALLPVLPLRSLPKIQSYQRDGIPWRSIRTAIRLGGSSVHFTACSRHMLDGAADGSVRWRTIFNGVDLQKYDFVPSVDAGAPLVFLGRLEPFKGAHHAIAIANQLGRRLVIAGNRVESASAYFESMVAPGVDGQRIVYVGPVDDAGKNAVLGSAAALLMPIEWDEPFGIVMAEAFACGTPVVGLARGSVPEVVRDGINGFVCSSVDEMCAAVGRLGEINRGRVRADCEARFSAEAIVNAYEQLYWEALAERDG